MKQQLAALIEAYAAARASGNSLLLEFAAKQLNEFVSEIEIIKNEKTSDE